jgi:dolichol-phosphate mannosyltransferase
MIPMLDEGVDLVTASPYHPEGGVANVPGWRLFLSRGCSRLYRIALGESIHTFTACFRVYRRVTVERIRVDRAGFLGIAELIGKLSVQGGGIREYPALLETRVMGRSSMKVVRTVLGHLGLLASLVWLRARGGQKDGGTRLASGDRTVQAGPLAARTHDERSVPGPGAHTHR